VSNLISTVDNIHKTIKDFLTSLFEKGCSMTRGIATNKVTYDTQQSGTGIMTLSIHHPA